MRYRMLGTTGVEVSVLTLGAMNFGPFGGTDENETTPMVRRAIDAGVTVIDTADVYSEGRSEELVRAALKGVPRDDVVLASKFGLNLDRPANRQGGSRRWIMQAIEGSLRRLGVDHIDLYQLHRPDRSTQIDETIGALTDLQRAGKIRYFGTSTFSAVEIVESQWASERNRAGRFVSEQSPYSILGRGIEVEVLPTAQRYGLGVLTWSPLAGGVLSGRHRPGSPVARSTRQTALGIDIESPGSRADRAAAAALSVLADEAGISMIDLALGFAASHPVVSTVIVGPRTLAQLDSQLSAGDRVLSADVLDRIDEIVPPGLTVNLDQVEARPAALDRVRRRRQD